MGRDRLHVSSINRNLDSIRGPGVRARLAAYTLILLFILCTICDNRHLRSANHSHTSFCVSSLEAESSVDAKITHGSDSAELSNKSRVAWRFCLCRFV